MNSSSSSGLRAGAAAALVACALVGGPARAQESLRPEVGKPLQAAQELIKSGRYREALAKVRDAEAAGARNANETYLIERMRLAAASGAGDADTAARSFEALSASGRVSPADKLRMTESIASTYYRSQQYAKAMQWSQRYLKEGGTSPAIRTMLIQSQYLSGDFAGAAKELTAEVQAAERAGTPPAEDRLKLLLNAAVKQGDNNAYVFAMEKLVTYYPKKEYWVDLLSRMQRKANFSDRLALDAYRLSLATGSMSAPADFMEMAQLALQADLASEGKQVIDKGISSGAFSSGAQADRAKRLKALVDKKLAEDTASRAEDERHRAVAPVRLDVRLVDLLDVRGHARRIVVGARVPREAVQEHERRHALGMRRCSHHGHLRRVAVRDERCPLRSLGVHDGDEVVHPPLDRRVPDDGRGHADPAHVEPEHPREACEREQERLEQRLLGEGLEMCPPVVGEDDVDRPLAVHAVGDVGVATARVPRARRHQRSSEVAA